MMMSKTTKPKIYAYGIQFITSTGRKTSAFDKVIYSNSGITFNITNSRKRIVIEDIMAKEGPTYYNYSINDINLIAIVDIPEEKIGKVDVFYYALGEAGPKDVVCLGLVDLNTIATMYDNENRALWRSQYKSGYERIFFVLTKFKKNSIENIRSSCFIADIMTFSNGKDVIFHNDNKIVFETDLDNLEKVYSLKFNEDRTVYFDEFKKEYESKEENYHESISAKLKEKEEPKVDKEEKKEANEGEETKKENTDDVLIVEWHDEYYESFIAKAWRLGSDVIWIKLSGDRERHIPLRSVRGVVHYLKEEQNKEQNKRIAIRWFDGRGTVFNCIDVKSGSDTLHLICKYCEFFIPLRSVRWWGRYENEEMSL